MQTEKIVVDSSGVGLADALDAAEKFARQSGLDEKQTRRVRLLSEETLAMVRAIVVNFQATFWLEKMPNGCKIHLAAETAMDYIKKQDLIDVSTKRRNEASVGIMGKIRDIIEDSCSGFAYAGGTSTGLGVASTGYDSYLWTLKQYREDLQDGRAENDPVWAEKLAEVEHSIVANLADDVSVSVRGNRVEMIIEKLWR